MSEARASFQQVERDLAAALERRGAAIECAWLFGSVTRGEAGPLSDIDVGILFADSLPADARLEAAAAVAGEVQRLDGPLVDITILNEAPPALRHRVVRDGRLLLARDDLRRVEFEVRAIREYLDFLPVLERYDRALLKRAREGRLGT